MMRNGSKFLVFVAVALNLRAFEAELSEMADHLDNVQHVYMKHTLIPGCSSGDRMHA